MRELTGDQISVGDKTLDRAAAACLGLGGLDEGIDRFDAAVGESGVESVEDAVQVILERLSDPLDGLEAAAAGPLVPALEQRRGARPIGRAAVDPAMRILDAKGPLGLEAQALGSVYSRLAGVRSCLS